MPEYRISYSHTERNLLYTLQSTLKSGQEARIAHIDFRDRVKHQGILYLLCSVRNGGSVLSEP